MKSRLAPHQIAQLSFDEVNNAIQTTIVGTEMAVELRVEDGDSVRVFNGDEPAAPWDYYSQVLSSGDTVVTRTYRSGGPSGTVVGTVVYTYSTSARTFLVSLQRS